MNCMITVIQIRIKVYLLENISVEQIPKKIAEFLDYGLSQDSYFAKFHEENKFKQYSVDWLYPFESDKVYKKDRIYTLTIRTIDRKLAEYFAGHVVNVYTKSIKGITAEVRVVPQKHIDLLYSVTPIILKCEKGYWKDSLTPDQYEERLKVNLLKKWKQFCGEKLPEDFEMFTGIEFLNKCPIAVEFKGKGKDIRLLGDKLCLHIAENENAQKLAYLAIGTGVGELNARSAGFCNYRWL